MSRRAAKGTAAIGSGSTALAVAEEVQAPAVAAPSSGHPGRLKRIVVTLVLLGALAGVGVVIWRTVGTTGTKSSTVTNTVVAAKGNVLQTVSATGNVITPTQVAASFAQSGTVTSILVKNGDTVTAGQPLAKIDDTTQLAALATAKASYDSTKAGIDAANAGPAQSVKDQDTIAAQQATNAVDAAKANLANAQATASQDYSTGSASVQTAQSNLEQANTTLATDQQTLQEDQDAYNGAQLSIDPQKDPGESANQTLIRYQHDNDQCSAKQTPADGVDCNNLAYLTRLFNSVVSQTKAVTQDKNSVTQASNSLTSAKRSLSATQTRDSQSIATAQRSVESANLSLMNTVVGNQAKEAAPTPQTVDQQNAQLSQAQQSVDTAQKNEDDTTLKAPVAGVIVAINGTVGLSSGGSSSSSGSSGSAGSSSSSSSGFMTIADLVHLQVKAGFAEADAAKLQLGQAATVTFDALPNVTATAKVTAIDSLATVASNVVTYNVTLTLDSTPASVKPGMTSTASIVADHRDGVTYLPASAVPTRGTTGTLTVRAKNGKESQVRIGIGLRGDSTVEITSGLNAGDTVVLRTTTTGGGTSTRPGGLGTGTGTPTGGAFTPPGG